jgi:hypothetical protein
LEVVVLSARQAPVEHPRRRVADVLEAVHHVARDENDRAGAGRSRMSDTPKSMVTRFNAKRFLGWTGTRTARPGEMTMAKSSHGLWIG